MYIKILGVTSESINIIIPNLQTRKGKKDFKKRERGIKKLYLSKANLENE